MNMSINLTYKQITERKQAVLNQVWFLAPKEQEDLEGHFLMRCSGESLIDATYEGQSETRGQHYLKYLNEIYLLNLKNTNLEMLEKLTETDPLNMLLSFRKVKLKSGLYNTVLVQQCYEGFDLGKYAQLAEYVE